MTDITKLAEWMGWEKWARYYLVPNDDAITEASTMGRIEGTLTPAGAVAVYERLSFEITSDHEWEATRDAVELLRNTSDFCTAVRDTALAYLEAP